MNSKQAIILYAKHWFEETDLFKDLQKLWNIDYGYDCSKRDVAELMLGIAQKLIQNDTNNRWFFEFVNDIHKDQHWKFGRKNESGNFDDHWYGVISKTLSMLSVGDTKNLEAIFGPICRPDYSVLPMSKSVTEESVERIFKDRG